MLPRFRLRTMRLTSLARSSMMIGTRNEGRRWVALTFSRELKGDDSVALFERGWLPIGCLNVNVDGVVWGVTLGH